MCIWFREKNWFCKITHLPKRSQLRLNNFGNKKFTLLRTWVLFNKYWNSSLIYVLSGWWIMNIIEQVTKTYLVQYSGTLTQGGVVKWFTPPGQHCTEITKVSKTLNRLQAAKYNQIEIIRVSKNPTHFRENKKTLISLYPFGLSHWTLLIQIQKIRERDDICVLSLSKKHLKCHVVMFESLLSKKGFTQHVMLILATCPPDNCYVPWY